MSSLSFIKDSVTEFLSGSTGESEVSHPDARASNAAMAADASPASYVAQKGDTISGIAERGTGDPLRFRELNLFNGREAEDASLEIGQSLQIPADWDHEALGIAPAPREEAPEHDEPESEPGRVEGIVEDGREMIDDAWEAGEDMLEGAIDWWYDDGEEKEAPTEEPAGPTTREDMGMVNRGADGKVEQTVDVGSDGEADSTLDLARSRADLDETHYKREGETVEDAREQWQGDADRDSFWCSGLSMWTLGAAGYDLEAEIPSANGEPHAYIDGNGYQPIMAYMIVDGYWEAVQALGQIAANAPGGDVTQCDGYAVFLDSNEVRDYSGHDVSKGDKGDDLKAPDPETGVPVRFGTLVQAGSDSVDKGFQGEHLYEDGTFEDTEAGANYDDNFAVMGAAGMFELMGIGERVDGQDIRPGDFAQTRYRNGGEYYGKGHASQVDEVRVRGSAWFGRDGSPELLEGDVPATPTFLVDVEFKITDDTDASLVADDVELQGFTVIEANIKGAAGNSDLDDSGGVGESDERGLDFRFDTVDDRRDYFGRLFESKWSSKNWSPAEGPAEESPDESEEGGVLDPLWDAIGWE